MSGFHFCPSPIFKNCLGSRDTTRNITVKKNFFFTKILKTIHQLKDLKKMSVFQKNTHTENKQGLTYFKLSFL